MDYPSAGSESTGNDSLVYAQWEAIHNPALVGKPFQDDEDGLYAPPINPVLRNKGVCKIFANCIANCDWGEDSTPEIVYSNGFNHEALIAAFDLAKQVPEFQQALNLVSDNKNAIRFVEYSYDNPNQSRVGSSEEFLHVVDAQGDCSLAEGRLNESLISRYARVIGKNPNNYFFAIEITLYPNTLNHVDPELRAARMAITLAHELFIHSTGIEALELYKKHKYLESLTRCDFDTGESGLVDHRAYMQGYRVKMDNFFDGLETILDNAIFEQAKTSHDQKYNHLK